LLIAQAIFLLEKGHTDRNTHTHKVTDTTDNPTHASATYGIGNNSSRLDALLFGSAIHAKALKETLISAMYVSPDI